jgi:predicted transcriptional regulator
VAITDKELRGLVAASDLKSKDRTTLLALADGLNRQTLVISMGGDRLAEMLGLKRRQAVRRLRSLEATGVIVPIRQGGGRAEDGRGYVNTWKLDPERLRGTSEGVSPRARIAMSRRRQKGALQGTQECRRMRPTQLSKIPKRRTQAAARRSPGGRAIRRGTRAGDGPT